MERTVVVTGSGMSGAPPDLATVRFAVAADAPDVSAALKRLGELVSGLGAAVRAASVADRDIQTSSLSVFPSYDEQGRQVVGYRAQHSVTVKVRRLDDLSAVVGAGVDAGSNQVTIDSIGLGLADPTAVESEAREAAVADARRKGAELAGHAGARLGSVLALSEVGIGAVQPRAFKLAAADVGGMPIEVGEETVTISVEVTFALD